jgi:hypothetical protein
MASIIINGQHHTVHEEVAVQFSKYIRKIKAKDQEIEELTKRILCMGIEVMEDMDRDFNE